MKKVWSNTFKKKTLLSKVLIMRFENFNENLIDEITFFYRKAATETNFLGFHSHEYTFVNNFSYMLLAIDNNKIVGIITITKGCRLKNSHVGTLGIAILQEYCSKGLGTKLMDMALKWSKEQGLHKIVLVVREDNGIATKLYEKFGFNVEGIMKDETLIDGTYYNSLYMSRIL